MDKLTTSVHSTVAADVGEETANRLLTGFGSIHTQMVKAADGAGQLSTGLSVLTNKTATLPDDSRTLATGAAQVAAGSAQLNRPGHGLHG